MTQPTLDCSLEAGQKSNYEVKVVKGRARKYFRDWRLCKVLWDFSFRADHVTEGQRPDMTIADKKKTIINFAVPRDSRVEQEEKNTEKYQPLASQLLEICNARVQVNIIS